MANFDLTNLAVKMICPNNVVKTDDTDLPSVLVYIPKFKNSDVLTGGNDSTHPAFIVNGVEIPGFYYGKYQAKVYNSVAYVEQRCVRWCVLPRRLRLPRLCVHARRLPCRLYPGNPVIWQSENLA